MREVWLLLEKYELERWHAAPPLPTMREVWRLLEAYGLSLRRCLLVGPGRMGRAPRQ